MLQLIRGYLFLILILFHVASRYFSVRGAFSSLPFSLLSFVVAGALFFSCQYVFRLLFKLLLVMHIFGLGLG
jgi:hypothetical protein